MSAALNRITLEVEYDSLSTFDQQDDSHPSAFAYLWAAGKRYPLERRGDYVEDGCVFRVHIDEDVVREMTAEFTKLAANLGVPLEIDGSFREYPTEEDDDG